MILGLYRDYVGTVFCASCPELVRLVYLLYRLLKGYTMAVSGLCRDHVSQCMVEVQNPA